MATIPFQASLTDANGTLWINTNNLCNQLTIQDQSNYNTNNDFASALNNFAHFRQIIITYYQGNVITMSSIAGVSTGNPIQPASSAVMSYGQPLITGDGWYVVTLETCPDWTSSNGGVGYVAGYNQVYNTFDGKLYTCISSNLSTALNRPDLAPTLWQAITPSQLSSKYSVSYTIALHCNLDNCLPAKIQQAFCANPNFGCNNSSFCTNPSFLDAARLVMIKMFIDTAGVRNQLQTTGIAFDASNLICSCQDGSNFNNQQP